MTKHSRTQYELLSYQLLGQTAPIAAPCRGSIEQARVAPNALPLSPVTPASHVDMPPRPAAALNCDLTQVDGTRAKSSSRLAQ